MLGTVGAGFPSLEQWMYLAGAVASTIAAVTLIARSPVGKFIGYVYRRIFGEPVTEKFTQVVTNVVTPQLTRLESKNDSQHAENKKAIDGLKEAITEHQLAFHDGLFELRSVLDKHFTEAHQRDVRIAALEQIASSRITALEERGIGRLDIRVAAADVNVVHDPTLDAPPPTPAED